MVKKTNNGKPASKTSAFVRPYTLMIDNQRFAGFCVAFLSENVEPPGPYLWKPVPANLAAELQAIALEKTS